MELTNNDGSIRFSVSNIQTGGSFIYEWQRDYGTSSRIEKDLTAKESAAALVKIYKEHGMDLFEITEDLSYE
jgi:hypothetical protein